jgi:hypothetical protein
MREVERVNVKRASRSGTKSPAHEENMREMERATNYGATGQLSQPATTHRGRIKDDVDAPESWKIR